MSTCGFRSFCGRNAGHAGQHGGWRVRVSAVAPQPIIHSTIHSGLMVGSSLSPREIQCVAETFIHGDHAAAAACIGIGLQTFKNHISYALQRTGSCSVKQAAYLLGWITLPPGTYHGASA